MSFLLDTNICIFALNQSSPGLEARLRRAKRSELHVSSVTVAELFYGAARSKRSTANTERVIAFVEPLRELPFDHAAAETYASLRAHLASKGKPIGPMDLLIAATALAHGLSVVTNNRKEFDRFPALRTEDWSGLSGE